MSFKIAEAYVEVTTRDDTGSGEARIRERLNRIRGTAKVDVDVNTSSLLRARAEVSQFGNSMQSSGNRALAIFAAITAAAPVAAAAVAALPAAVASLGGVAAVLLGSFHGVGDALKGYAADSEAAAQTSTKSAATELSNARQIRDAQQSIGDARARQARAAQDARDAIQAAQRDEIRVAREGADAIEAASKRVDAALEKEKDAQAALTEAQHAAELQIESLAEKVHDLALDQEGAAIAVIEAQQRLDKILADSTTTDLDKRKAQYDLAVAQERVRDLTKEQTDATSELADANAKGVNGSDQVVAAQKRVTEAHQGVLDSRQDLAKVQRDADEASQDAARRVAKAVEDGAQAQEDANIAVARALQGLRDAQESQAASAAEAAVKTSKFADAMAKLNPQQRELVQQLLRMKPLVEGLSATSSRGFLPGFTQMLRDSEGLFPIFNAGLERTSTIMGDASRKAGEMFKSTEFKTNLDNLFRATDPITRSLGDGFVNLSGRLVKFGADMAPAAQGFANFLDMTITGLDRFFDRLTPHSESFKRIFDALGRIMEQLLPAIGDVVGQLADYLAPALEKVAGWMERNHEKIGPLIEILGGLFLTIKAVNIVRDVERWVTGVIGLFDRLGFSAETSKGKVSGLRTALGIGAASAAADIIGDQLGLKPTDDPFSAKGTGGTALDTIAAPFQFLTGQRVGIFDRIKQDLESLPGDFDRAGDRIKGWGNGIHDVVNHVGDWFGNMRDRTVGTLSGWVQDGDTKSNQIVGNIGNWISRLPGNVGGWFEDMRNRASDRLGNLRDSAWQTTSSTWNNISSWFGRLPGDVGGWFGDMRNRAWGWLDNLRGGAIDLATRIRDGVVGAFNAMADWATGAWNRLRDAAAAPIRWIIDPVYNRGILPLWNRVVDIFGGTRPQPLAQFAAGGVIPGYAPGRDTVPAMLSRGEGILVPEAVQGLGAGFVHWANRTFSGGRASSNGGNGHFAAGGIVGDAASYVKGLFAGVLGDGAKTPGVGWLRDAAASFPAKILDLAIEKVKGLFSSGGGGVGLGPPSANQIQHTQQIVNAAKARGIGHAGAVIAVMTGLQESGVRILANPAVPASLNFWHEGLGYDHDSVGIFQQRQAGWGTIAERMNAFASAGMFFNKLGRGPYGDYGREAQRVQVSAFPGAYSKWQGKAEGMVSGVGYDSGGWLPRGLTWAHNRTGRPERVLSARQTEAFERLVDQITRSHANQVTTSGGVTVNVTQASGNPMETGRFVRLALMGVG